MGLWILQECKREWDEQGDAVSFTELVVQAERAEPFRSLIHPDNPSFFAPSGMIAKIQSFCRETSQAVPQTKGEVARCVLESLALRYRQALEQMEALTGQSFNGLHMVGGGIQNELLCRFTANAIGRPVWTGPVEASAIGNMLMQLVALGKCSSLQDARQLAAASFPIETYDPAQTDEWNTAYETFKGLCQPK
jgi:rhamnulokinase